MRTGEYRVPGCVARDAYRRLPTLDIVGAVAGVPAGASPFATQERADEGRTK
jgi:hypothetical protein